MGLRSQQKRAARKRGWDRYGPGINAKDGTTSWAIRTQDEVAAAMGISRTRVQQLERSAIAKIRKALGVTLCAIALSLAACGDHRGEVDERCRPDGSCISEKLMCVQTWYGAICEVRP